LELPGAMVWAATGSESSATRPTAIANADFGRAGVRIIFTVKDTLLEAADSP
jgi:hypothetical protein